MAQQGSNAHDNPTATSRVRHSRSPQGAQSGMGPGRRCAKAVVKSADAVFLRAVRRLLCHPLMTSVC